jgi:hypothetical protein
MQPAVAGTNILCFWRGKDGDGKCFLFLSFYFALVCCFLCFSLTTSIVLRCGSTEKFLLTLDENERKLFSSGRKSFASRLEWTRLANRKLKRSALFRQKHRRHALAVN